MKHTFVSVIPDKLDEGILYVSIQYNTALHKCACGCGEEVVTPITPSDWKITYNGESVSLYPSIGNWSYKCKSHYWIKENKIVWAEMWSDKKINEARKQDKKKKGGFFGWFK